MNVEITKIQFEDNSIYATFHSYKLNRDYSILQWIPKENHVRVSILKPDGEIGKGFGEQSLTGIQMNTPLQFERYGFVNPIRFEYNELICYFTH